MEFKATEVSLNYFSDSDQQLLSDVFPVLQQAMPVIDGNVLQADNALDILDTHKIEHGVGVGFIQQDGETTAIGGLHYLADVALYELVCIPLPGHEDAAPIAIDYLIHHAFYALGMDKVCARTLQNSDMDNELKAAGFTCYGEWAFTEEGRESIWNYYEMENDANMVSSIGHYSDANNSWDGIF